MGFLLGVDCVVKCSQLGNYKNCRCSKDAEEAGTIRLDCGDSQLLGDATVSRLLQKFNNNPNVSPLSDRLRRAPPNRTTKMRPLGPVNVIGQLAPFIRRTECPGKQQIDPNGKCKVPF